MSKKKQEVMFYGVTRNNKPFVTASFQGCILNSKNDPVPLNRKSNRAMLKLIQGMGNDDKTEDQQKADRIKKEKRKKSKKSAYISRRINSIRSRAS